MLTVPLISLLHLPQLTSSDLFNFEQLLILMLEGNIAVGESSLQNNISVCFFVSSFSSLSGNEAAFAPEDSIPCCFS